MSDAWKGLLAWSAAGLVWWAVGSDLTRGELSELAGFPRLLLEHGWIAWMTWGIVLFVVYTVIELSRKG